jgi:subfamily B ATP-binding cassette protein MsbA
VKSWRSLIIVAGRQVWLFPLFVALALAATAAEAGGLGMLVVLLQLLLAGPNEVQSSGAVVDFVRSVTITLVGNSVMAIAFATVSLIMAKSLMMAAYQILSAHVNASVNDRFRRLAFRRLMEADYGKLVLRDSGSFQNLITGESMRVTEALGVISHLLVNICSLIVFLVMLLLISWQLVVVMVLGTFAAYAVSMLLGGKARQAGQIVTSTHALLATRLESILSGLRMVRIFGAEDREIQRFNAYSGALRQGFMRVQLLKAATGPISDTFYLCVFVGIVGVSSQIHVPLASVITFVLIVARLQPHVKDIHWCRVQLSGLGSAVDAMADFLQEFPGRGASVKGKRFEGMSDRIRFDRVAFSYGEGREPTLRGISFTIQKKRTTAIVGGSGAGKSTLVNLLLRLYEPSSGCISADGHPVDKFDVASWRARFALAGQDAELLDGTILENVRYGRPSASLQDAEAAAEKAGILAFIRGLPSAWDTRVGGRGVRLSGGQRQRLGIARAILREPDLLILDEATNSLDSLTEAEVQGAIEAMAGKITLVVIAHKLSTVMSADHAIVLRNGEIEEQGTPQQLLVRAGHFSRLYSAAG